MRHPGIRIIVVTGGPGVVNEAMRSGKKVIAGARQSAGRGRREALTSKRRRTASSRRVARQQHRLLCEKEIIGRRGYRRSPAGASRPPRRVSTVAGRVCPRGKLVLDGDHPEKWVGKDGP